MSVITWLMSLLMFGGTPKGDDTADIPKTIYEFKVETLDGGTIDFSEFKGKKIVTVGCSSTERYLSTPLAEKVREEVSNLPVAEI